MLSLALTLIETEEQKSKFEMLHSRYNSFLYKIIFSYIKDEHIAEDCLQEVWFSIAKIIDKIDTSDENKLKSFLFTVAKNKAHNIIKSNKKHSFISFDDIPDPESKDDLIEKLEESESYMQLIKAIISLPDIYKEVLRLKILNKLDCNAISVILSLNINTVKSRLNRGKKMILELIKEYSKNE